MSLKDDLISDLEIFFDADDFADPVIYKPKSGSPIETVALVDIGEDLGETSRGLKASGTISLMTQIVGTPSYRDLVEIDGEDWAVVRVISRDSAVVTLEIRSDVRGVFK